MKKRKEPETTEEVTSERIEEINTSVVNTIGPSKKKKKDMLLCKGCFEFFENLKECSDTVCDECYCEGCYNAFAIKSLHKCANCEGFSCNRHTTRCNSFKDDKICQYGNCKKCDEDKTLVFKSCVGCKSKFCSVCLKHCKIPTCDNLVCEECIQTCETCSIDLCSKDEPHICSKEMTDFLLDALDSEKRGLINTLYNKTFYKKPKKGKESVDSDDQDTEEDTENLNQDDRLISQINLLIEDELSDLILEVNGNKDLFIKRVEEVLRNKFIEKIKN